MSNADKVIRILLAVAIVLLYNANIISGAVAIILLIFATAFVLTGLIGFCPLYFPLGISTKKSRK